MSNGAPHPARGRRGWKQWTPEQAHAALREWKESGLGAEQFAASKGVSAQRLYYWRSRLGREASDAPSAFIAVTLPAQPPRQRTAAPSITSAVASGATIAIDAGHLRIHVRETIGDDRLEGVVRAIERAMRRC